MITDIQSLKEAARKEVTNDYTGHSFLIRKLDVYDFMRAQMTPVIGLPKDVDGKLIATDAETLNVVSARVQHILEKGAAVFFGPEDKTPEGAIHISWIPEDAGWLSDQILAFSGLDKESQDKVEALVKNAHGSETSTKSDESSENFPVS